LAGYDTVIRAFSAEHVERLTGLSAGQLRRWDAEGFFQPTYAYENRRSPYSRVYSFKDVVGLRVVSMLRHEHKISMQQLRKVAAHLHQHSSTPWADITLYVLNKEVQFREPATGKIRVVLSGQYVNIPLISVIEDMRQKSEELRKRRQEQFGAVERHRYVAHNAPVVAGTRIPIATIVRFANAGYAAKEIIREYPSLTAADIKAALEATESLEVAS
jgi:uncharacterized protein (DUF433 family)